MLYRARCEISCFVEFAVIRDILLGDSSQQGALFNDDSAVIQLSAICDRSSDDEEHIQLLGLLGYPGKSFV